MPRLLSLSLLLVPALALHAGSPALLSDDFSGGQLAPEWKAAKGAWTVSNGVLRGVELPADKHAAVVRRPVAYHDAVIEVDFRLDGARQWALSLNRKGGHACRVIVRLNEMVLQRDKMNAKSADPARKLAASPLHLEAGAWHKLTLTVRGAKMTASVDGGSALEGEDPGVDVDKVDVGLPVSGSSASFRNLSVRALP